MSIAKKYVITLCIELVILIGFVSVNAHYNHNIHTAQQNITQLQRPKEIKSERFLTGTKKQPVGQFTLLNDNEKQQIKFGESFLTNHFTYNTASSYADNRNKSHQQMTNALWKKVQNNEFSPQTNRIGDSLISENRSTSNYISADPYVATNTLPEHNMKQQNIPIYYLVTSSYTDNKNDSGESGKQSTLIRMRVDAQKSIVSDYQVLNRTNY